MFSLWSDLAPLMLASAALPLQTFVTLLLVKWSIRSAYAWVGGMTAIHLLQGILFGLVLRVSEGPSQPKSLQFFLGALLLVLALLFYAKAARTALRTREEDAPPPQWVVKASLMSPRTAFGAGAGFMSLSVKFLVFTLGAISAIADAHLGVKLAAITYVLFVIPAHAVPFAILALASSSSSRSAAILQGFRMRLERNHRLITIIFGLVFGTWFLLKALTRLGLI